MLHVVPPSRADATAAASDAGGASPETLHAGAEVDRVFNEPGGATPVQFKVVRHASPVEAAVQESAGYDLLIVGLAEQWGLESHLFGFRTERIAEASACSLLMVRKYPRPAVHGATATDTDAEFHEIPAARS